MDLRNEFRDLVYQIRKYRRKNAYKKYGTTPEGELKEALAIQLGVVQGFKVLLFTLGFLLAFIGGANINPFLILMAGLCEFGFIALMFQPKPLRELELKRRAMLRTREVERWKPSKR